MSTLKVNSIQSFTPSEPVTFDDTVHFTVEISGGLVPNADDSFDLGSATKQWKDLYVDGTANIDTGSIGELEVTKLTISSNNHGGPGATISTASIGRLDVDSLPTSDPGHAGRLFTQLGSQLGLGSITGSIATKKFVLVS